ncbi:hypothetical protein O181_084612 [Austropuccinia psidii MF-1]|uniref:Uncharacterized protein n=1 Tax=Austropuccinia psidii MF-1 TaxID=1389203 RepID=A0A9Q3FUK3_9BASI|nr:hypothetical protein [Austropuccinia psidii MF-1]
MVFYLKWTDSDVLNILLAYFLVISSKPTELTESSPSAMPASVLCGSGILSRLASPSMASLGHFDPSQTYDGYKAVEVLDPACTECFAKVTGSRQRDVGGPILVGDRPIYSSSEFQISRINTDGVVNRIRRIPDSPPDTDAEGSDELDGEEVEVVPHLVDHQSTTSSSQPLANRFHSHIIPSTPRTFQPTLSAIPTSLPPASPSPSHARPAFNQAVRQSPITTSQHLQPMASGSRRRDGFSPLPFPAAQVFQRRDSWPI